VFQIAGNAQGGGGIKWVFHPRFFIFFIFHALFRRVPLVPGAPGASLLGTGDGIPNPPLDHSPEVAL